MSAAALILACATGTRAASKMSSIMVHEISTANQGKASDIRANADHLENLEDLEILDDNLSDSQSVNNNDFELTHEENENNFNIDEKNDDNSILTSNLKTININLEETNSESLDYRKLSLSKLRSIVTEKSLAPDVSKLKKNDLLKLLGIE
jgi:hypothetical protein